MFVWVKSEAQGRRGIDEMKDAMGIERQWEKPQMEQRQRDQVAGD